jgi:hypothetical protein
MKQYLNIKMKVSCLCGDEYEIESGSLVLDNAVERLREFINFHKGHKSACRKTRRAGK